MYREGLARFGTDKFTLNDLRNPFRHLTNTSINKQGPGYAEMKDRIGCGKFFVLEKSDLFLLVYSELNLLKNHKIIKNNYFKKP